MSKQSLASLDGAPLAPGGDRGEIAEAHDWFDPQTEFPNLTGGYESCRKCGLNRGPKNEAKPCQGAPDMRDITNWFRGRLASFSDGDEAVSGGLQTFWIIFAILLASPSLSGIESELRAIAKLLREISASLKERR